MWYYMVLRSDLEQNVCYRGYGTMSGLRIKTLFPDVDNICPVSLLLSVRT